MLSMIPSKINYTLSQINDAWTLDIDTIQAWKWKHKDEPNRTHTHGEKEKKKERERKTNKLE